MGCAKSKTATVATPESLFEKSSHVKIQGLEEKLARNRERFVRCVKEGRTEEARAISAESGEIRAAIRKLLPRKPTTTKFTISPLVNQQVSTSAEHAALPAPAAGSAPTTPAPPQNAVSPVEQDQNPS